MKKFLAFSIIMFGLMLTSSTLYSVTAWTMPAAALCQPPQLYVLHIPGEQTIRAVRGFADRVCADENCDVCAFNSMHPLHIQQTVLDNARLRLEDAYSWFTLLLNFTEQPQSVYVRRWNVADLGTPNIHEAACEPVYVHSYTITGAYLCDDGEPGGVYSFTMFYIGFPNDGQNHVYEVFALLDDDSYALFTFRTIHTFVGFDNIIWYDVRYAQRPSIWAASDVDMATEKGFVPLALQSQFTRPITRAEFAILAVTLYESMRGEITGRATFADTSDTNVEKAAYIGIVSGLGDNRFDPDGTLTREQAAVMLSRLAEAITGRPIGFYLSIRFLDSDAISPWAKEGVFKMLSHDIMTGVGDNIFAPQQPYTREQSIVTIMRVFDFVNNETSTQMPEQPITALEVREKVFVDSGSNTHILPYMPLFGEVHIFETDRPSYKYFDPEWEMPLLDNLITVERERADWGARLRIYLYDEDFIPDFVYVFRFDDDMQDTVEMALAPFFYDEEYHTIEITIFAGSYSLTFMPIAFVGN